MKLVKKGINRSQTDKTLSDITETNHSFANSGHIVTE